MINVCLLFLELKLDTNKGTANDRTHLPIVIRAKPPFHSSNDFCNC